MTAHRQIMLLMGEAVRDSETVRALCVGRFGSGLAVHVGAYPDNIPGEKDAPFCWLVADGENESEKADETFTVRLVVGACVRGANGEKRISETVTARTAEANGLTVNGANAAVEELRDAVLDAIRAAHCGAIVNAVRRTENDISHFPLEWAEAQIDYLEPEAL